LRPPLSKRKEKEKRFRAGKMRKIAASLSATIFLVGVLCWIGAPFNHNQDNLSLSHNIPATFNLAVNQYDTDNENDDFTKLKFVSRNAQSRAFFIKLTNHKPEYRPGFILRFLSCVKLLS